MREPSEAPDTVWAERRESHNSPVVTGQWLRGVQQRSC